MRDDAQVDIGSAGQGTGPGQEPGLGLEHGRCQEPGPVLFSVIGLQNSGKTRFVLSALRTLRAHGLTVAVLKHDGHADAVRLNNGLKAKLDGIQPEGQGEYARDTQSSEQIRRILDWEKQGSDTMLAFEAGATMTMVTGGGQSLLHFVDDSDSPEVCKLSAQMAELAEHSGHPLDVIIVEGFKKGQLPKVFICRGQDHVSWLKEHFVDHVQAVVLPSELRDAADPSWPIFDESRMEEILRACGVQL
jgi:molybdopterin-guanine dinucleotide biosynthesis protein MobB